MKFKCALCNYIYERDGRAKVIRGKRYIISYCEKSGQMTKMYKVKEPKQ